MARWCCILFQLCSRNHRAGSHSGGRPVLQLLQSSSQQQIKMQQSFGWRAEPTWAGLSLLPEKLWCGSSVKGLLSICSPHMKTRVKPPSLNKNISNRSKLFHSSLTERNSRLVWWISLSMRSEHPKRLCNFDTALVKECMWFHMLVPESLCRTWQAIMVPNNFEESLWEPARLRNSGLVWEETRWTFPKLSLSGADGSESPASAEEKLLSEDDGWSHLNL